MKVVLFCGGRGLRLREFAENVPKPMVPVGYRPIVWHLMRYYAHFGHHEFILCLGYRADAIKSYFLEYSEAVSNDFILEGGGARLTLLSSDIAQWRITFIDTGLDSNIGQRLMLAREHLGDDELFMANYADNVTDLDLNRLIASHRDSGRVGTFLKVRPPQTFHVVRSEPDGRVTQILPAQRDAIWINGGYFVFGREIFDYIRWGEELVLEPFQRLIERGGLGCYEHEGFWACMDTFKEREMLEELHRQQRAPWELWQGPPEPGCVPGAGR